MDDLIVASLAYLVEALNRIGTNADASGTTTLFSRLVRLDGLVDQVEGYTDTVEGLIGTANPATSGTDNLFKFHKKTDDTVGTINTNVSTINTKVGANTDASGTTTIFARLAQIAGYTDNIETSIGASADASTGSSLFAKLNKIIEEVDSVEEYTDSIEGSLTTVLADLTTIKGYTDGVEGAISSLQNWIDVFVAQKLGSVGSAGSVLDRLATIEGYTDSLESKIGQANPTTAGTDTVMGFLKGIMDKPSGGSVSRSYVASSAISAGDLVKFVNNQAKKLQGYSSAVSVGTGEVLPTNQNCNDIEVFRISDNRFVVFHLVYDTNVTTYYQLHIKTFDISADNVITQVNDTRVGPLNTNSACNAFAVIQNPDYPNRFGVAWANNSNYLYFTTVVTNLTGTNNATLYQYASGSYIETDGPNAPSRLTMVSNADYTKALVIYSANSNGYIKVVTMGMNGWNVDPSLLTSPGNLYSITNAGVSELKAERVANNDIVIVWSESIYSYRQAITCARFFPADNTWSTGGIFRNSASRINNQLCRISDTTVLLSSTANTGNNVYGQVLSVSVLTVSFGTEQTLATFTGQGEIGKIKRLPSTNLFLVPYESSDTADKRGSILGVDVSGTSLSVRFDSKIYTPVQVNQCYVTLDMLTANKGIFGLLDYSPFIAQLVAFEVGDGKWQGVAENSATAGGSVNVTLDGIVAVSVNNLVVGRQVTQGELTPESGTEVVGVALASNVVKITNPIWSRL